MSTGKFIGYRLQLLATRGKALSLLQKTSKKRTPLQFTAEQQQHDNDSTVTSATQSQSQTGLFMFNPRIQAQQDAAA